MQKYSCEYCDKKFPYKSHRELHQKSAHSDEKPYLCDECGATFKTKGNCELHKAKLHGENVSKECDICHKVFTTVNGCKVHKRHTHVRPKEKRPKIKKNPQYQCTDCGKLLLTELSLTNHLLIHSENRPVFNCVQCPRSFFNESSLEKHQMKHLNGPEYKCDICNKLFHAHGRLKKHIALHDRACKFCGKKFKKRDNLKEHENRHTDEKPFICRHCPNVSYHISSSLAKHYRTRHKGINLKGTGILRPQYGKPELSKESQHQQPQNQPEVKEPQQEPNLPQIPPQLDFMNMATPSNNFNENYFQVGFSSQNPLQITVTPNSSHFTNSGNCDQSKYLVL